MVLHMRALGYQLSPQSASNINQMERTLYSLVGDSEVNEIIRLSMFISSH